jgi:GTP cyclohydrolase I
MILECVGEDTTQEGLHDTPERYARAMFFFTKWYEQNVEDVVKGAISQEEYDGVITVKDIDIFSLCKHHLVPFTGKLSHQLIDTLGDTQYVI